MIGRLRAVLAILGLVVALASCSDDETSPPSSTNGSEQVTKAQLCKVLADVRDEWDKDARTLFREDDDGMHLDGALKLAADLSPDRLRKDYEAQMAGIYVASGRTPPPEFGTSYMEAITAGQSRVNKYASDRCGFEVW